MEGKEGREGGVGEVYLREWRVGRDLLGEVKG